MIISDEYRFVFIHIPKCAGTWVGRPLQRFDDTQGAFTRRVEHHPALGLLDYRHIPLATLRDHFPGEYAKVRVYASFAVVRDPMARFPSSLAEHIRLYGAGPVEDLSTAELERAALMLVDRLEREGDVDVLPAQYVHFQRQCSYVFDRGARIIDNLYTVSHVEDLLRDVGNLVGENLIVGDGRLARPARQTVRYRSDTLRRLSPRLRRFLSPLRTIRPLRRAVRWLRPLIFSPESAAAPLIDNERIRAFVSDYYSEDIALYESVAGMRWRDRPRPSCGHNGEPAAE